MSVVLDDHLLGDVIGDTVPPALARLLPRYDTATTNLYYFRLCRAALNSKGGTITGSWSDRRRHEATRALLVLSEDIMVLPMKDLAFRMAELARNFRLSTLGAEAVAAAEALGGRLCVWSGDVGPGIRSACASVRVTYHPIDRS